MEGEDMNYPTSDVQFLAQMVLKTRNGDQITVDEGHRLEEIAGVGHSTQRVAGMDPETLAHATRAGGQL